MTFKTALGITQEKTANIHVYLHFKWYLSHVFLILTCYYDIFDMIEHIDFDINPYVLSSRLSQAC